VFSIWKSIWKLYKKKMVIALQHLSRRDTKAASLRPYVLTSLRAQGRIAAQHHRTPLSGLSPSPQWPSVTSSSTPRRASVAARAIHSEIISHRYYLNYLVRRLEHYCACALALLRLVFITVSSTCQAL
jgi:hypothetical protein